MSKLRLYGQDGVITVRPERNGPDAVTWTPDNLPAGETGAGIVADDVTLDAREWEAVRLVVEFSDGSGGLVAGGSVDVTPLVSVPSDLADDARTWNALTAITGLAPGVASASVPCEGKDLAVRISAITLSGAADVSVRATGGTWASERAR